MAVVTAQTLLEFKHLDNALRNQVLFLGDPVWSHELDSIISVGAFLLRTFCDFSNLQIPKSTKTCNFLQLYKLRPFHKL